MVTIIGGNNIDFYGRHQRAADNAAGLDDDSRSGSITCHSGGVARNIAENLGRLGAKPRLITVFGDDHFGQENKAMLESVGVDTSLAPVINDAASDAYMAVYDGGGDMIIAINDMMLIDQLDGDILADALAKCDDAVMLVLDGNMSASALTLIFEAAKSKAWRIAVDTVSTQKAAKFRPYLDAISFIKCNRIEAAVLTGLPPEALAFDHARALRDCGITTALVSDGDKGFVIGHDEGYDMLEADHHGAVVTVSGAGDALMAGMIYGLSRQDDVMHAAALAKAMAAMTVTVEGPVHPDIKDVIGSTI